MPNPSEIPGESVPAAETWIAADSSLAAAADPSLTVDFQPQDPATASQRGPGTGPLTVIGRFAIKQVLGAGAFGTVYRAHDPLLDREVALKVPRFSDDTKATQERFVREAKSAARLRHPNVVAVFESGHADGYSYIATEFVDGTPLSRLLDDTAKLDLRQGVEWMRQIADALYYAHSEGVVHRDIKPANIMINAAGRPQVMDFGLAKRVADDAAQMTLEGTVLGTPAFMAPEQARGELSRVGPAADQYSVGVILYVILCGKLPYEGAAWSVMSRVGNVNAMPPTPCTIRAGIPRDLEACCLKAMEKSPEARYANLNELAEDLKRWLDGRTLVARPIGWGERFVRWCRRNRLIASLSGTLVALLLLATIVGYVLAFQFKDLAIAAKNESKNANDARAKETLARQDLERLLVDNYTENGLAASRQSNDRQSILWFAQAAHLSRSDAQRHNHNLTRFASWQSSIAIPTHAFRSTGTYCEALRFHPSGRYLLVEAFPWDCVIQDLESDRRLKLPVDGPITSALWSPDGKRLILAAHNTISIFDFPNMTEIRKWSHPDLVGTLAINAQGDRLAVGGDKAVALYKLDDSAVPPLTELGSRVHTIRFNNAGNRLAVSTDDKRLRAYDVPSGIELGAPSLQIQELAAESELLFSFVTDDRLVAADSARALRCWDLDKAVQAWEQPVGRVYSLEVSPNRKRIAVGSFDLDFKHTAQILDADTGVPSAVKVFHKNHVCGVNWHADGKTLLTCSGDYTASVTDIETGKPVVSQVPHNDIVLRGVWSPDHRSFATAHWSNALIRVWRLKEPSTHDFLASSGNKQGWVKVSRDGRTMILSGLDTQRTQHEVQVHDTQAGKPIGAKIRAAGTINDALFLPVGKLLVTGGSTETHPEHEVVTMKPLGPNGIIQFWNQATGQSAGNPLKTPTEPVALASDPDETTLVVLCDGGQLLLLDVKTRKVRRELSAFPGPFTDKGYVIRDRIRFAPDGRRFALWGFGVEVQLRDTASGELQHALRHKADRVYIHDARFSPQGTELVTCGSDNTCMGWDARTGKSVATLQHTGWVFNAQFNQTGDRLLTASSDRQARLWDWKTKSLLISTQEQDDQVYGVSFGPDESIFLTASRDGTVNAWETTTGKQIAPTRRFQNMAYQVQYEPGTGMLLVAGRLGGVAGISMADWVHKRDSKLSDRDLLRMAEIYSNQRILESGVAANLTLDEWYQHWVGK